MVQYATNKGEEMKKNVKFDYYDEIPSYVRIIMEMASENDKPLEKFIIKDVFNKILNTWNSEQIKEMVIVSSFFENYLYSLEPVDRIILNDKLYSTYIKSIILCNNIGDFNLVNRFFDRCYDKVKEMTGYYGFLENNEIIANELNVKRTI